MLDMFKCKYIWGVILSVFLITFMVSPGNSSYVREQNDVIYEENVK